MHSYKKPTTKRIYLQSRGGHRGGVNPALVPGPDPDFFYAFSALNNKTDERMKQFDNQRGPSLVHMRADRRREVSRCLSRSQKRIEMASHVLDKSKSGDVIVRLTIST